MASISYRGRYRRAQWLRGMRVLDVAVAARPHLRLSRTAVAHSHKHNDQQTTSADKHDRSRVVPSGDLNSVLSRTASTWAGSHQLSSRR